MALPNISLIWTGGGDHLLQGFPTKGGNPFLPFSKKKGKTGQISLGVKGLFPIKRSAIGGREAKVWQGSDARKRHYTGGMQDHLETDI